MPCKTDTWLICLVLITPPRISNNCTSIYCVVSVWKLPERHLRREADVKTCFCCDYHGHVNNYNSSGVNKKTINRVDNSNKRKKECHKKTLTPGSEIGNTRAQTMNLAGNGDNKSHSISCELILCSIIGYIYRRLCYRFQLPFTRFI